MRIETERLILEDYSDDDWDLLRSLYTDPGVLQYMLMEDTSEQAFKKAFTTFCEDRKSDKRRFYYLKMIEKKSGAYIGETGVNMFHRTDHGGVGSVGYALLQQYRKKGFAAEALQSTIAYWKQNRVLHKLSASINPKNAASRKVLLRCGFIKCAYLTKDFYGCNGWEDVEMYEYVF